MLYRFHGIVPSIQTYVISGFEQNMSKYRQRDDSQTLEKSLSQAVLTFIDLYNTKVVTWVCIYIVQYVTYGLVAEYLLRFLTTVDKYTDIWQILSLTFHILN